MSNQTDQDIEFDLALEDSKKTYEEECRKRQSSNESPDLINLYKDPAQAIKDEKIRQLDQINKATLHTPSQGLNRQSSYSLYYTNNATSINFNNFHQINSNTPYVNCYQPLTPQLPYSASLPQIHHFSSHFNLPKSETPSTSSNYHHSPNYYPSSVKSFQNNCIAHKPNNITQKNNTLLFQSKSFISDTAKKNISQEKKISVLPLPMENPNLTPSPLLYPATQQQIIREFDPLVKNDATCTTNENCTTHENMFNYDGNEVKRIEAKQLLEEEDNNFYLSPLDLNKPILSVTMGEVDDKEYVFNDKENNYWDQYKSLFSEKPALEPKGVFQTTQLDHFVTNVDSLKITIRLSNLWPKVNRTTTSQDPPNYVTCTFSVNKRVEELLDDAVGTLFSDHEIEMLSDIRNKVGLRLRGTDEILPNNACLGKIPSIAYLVNRSEEVEIEMVLFETIPTTRSQIDTEFEKEYVNLIKNAFDIDREKFVLAIEQLKEKLILFTDKDNNNSKRAIKSAVYNIGFLCNTVITPEPDNDLLRLFSSQETPNDDLKNNLLNSFIKLCETYLNSTLSTYTISLSYEYLKKKDIKSVYSINQNLKLNVTSIHKIPESWSRKYTSYKVVANLFHGMERLGSWMSIAKSINTFKFSPYINISNIVEFDYHIANLPRESILFFFIYGIGQINPPNNNQYMPVYHTNINSSSSTLSHDIDSKFSSNVGYSNNEFLGTCVTSIFDDNGLFRHNGQFLSIVKGEVPESLITEPWGARSLVVDKNEPLLYISLNSFDFDICFDKTEPQQVSPMEFDSLPFDHKETIQRIILKNKHTCKLTSQEKELIWCKRHYLMGIPEALMIVLRSVSAWDAAHLPQIYPLLKYWAKITPPIALELLLPYFPDLEVRKYAVDILRKAPTEFVFRMVPQLIQCLRYETYENSELAKFIAEKAVENKNIAFCIYWNCISSMALCGHASFKLRLESFIQTMCEFIDIENFKSDTARQHKFNREISNVAAAVKKGCDNRHFQVMMSHICDTLVNSPLRCHLKPSFISDGLDIENCSIFESNTKPIRLALSSKANSVYAVIFKVGDDLRQDALVLQCVNLMNDIWLRNELDLRMTAYQVLPTKAKEGFIELVPNCKSLSDIYGLFGTSGIYKDSSIVKWLKKNNPEYPAYRSSIENFRKSCAGWCVATYLLGIGDRHSNNILLTTSGNVFHIDFGKYLGDWQMAAGFKRDRVPFIFTPDMEFVIKNSLEEGSNGYHYFVNDCCDAFNLIRKNCSILLNALKLMKSSGIPNLSENSIAFVENNLQLTLSDEEAMAYFTRMIEESVNSVFPRLNFLVHHVANQVKKPFKSKTSASDNSTKDLTKFSFSSYVNSIHEDGKITSVLILDPEKWKNEDGEKCYMYKIKIERDKETVSTFIYRSFDEFQELHNKLVKSFSRIEIPYLLNENFYFNGNNRAPANKRHAFVAEFVNDLFTKSPEICESDLVYTFFHSINRDVDPDQVNVLQQSRSIDSNSVNPEIYLKFKFSNKEDVLTIFVGHVKNLPFIGTHEIPSPYVKVYLRPNNDSNLKRKTKIKKNEKNPMFNEVLTYNMTKHILKKYLDIHVSVWNSRNSIRAENHVIGSKVILISQILDSHKISVEGEHTLEGWFAISRA